MKWSICADTWLILPAVICSDKRLSHACLRTYLDTTNLWSTFGICLGPFWEFTKHERGSGKTRKTCHRRHNVRSAVSAHISPGALLLALSREKRKLRAQYWVPLAYGVIWACLLEFYLSISDQPRILTKFFFWTRVHVFACLGGQDLSTDQRASNQIGRWGRRAREHRFRPKSLKLLSEHIRSTTNLDKVSEHIRSTRNLDKVSEHVRSTKYLCKRKTQVRKGKIFEKFQSIFFGKKSRKVHQNAPFQANLMKIHENPKFEPKSVYRDFCEKRGIFRLRPRK